MSEENTSKQLPTSGLAIAGLVLGVLALVSSWMPIINNLSFVIGGLGAVLSVIGLAGVLKGKKGGKGVAIAAVVVNVLSLVIVFATQSAYSNAIKEATSSSEGTTAAVSAPAATDAAAPEQKADEPAYAISGEELTGNEYSVTISGTFTNTSGEQLSYVQLSYRLLDASGAQLGTALANTNNLPAGADWKFEATGFYGQDEVATYELADVTMF